MHTWPHAYYIHLMVTTLFLNCVLKILGLLGEIEYRLYIKGQSRQKYREAIHESIFPSTLPLDTDI